MLRSECVSVSRFLGSSFDVAMLSLGDPLVFVLVSSLWRLGSAWLASMIGTCSCDVGERCRNEEEEVLVENKSTSRGGFS